jgi:integrase
VSGQINASGRAPTKTRAGRRTVDIGPLTLRLLRQQQLARAPNEPGLLFPTRTGGPFERHNFMARVFKPADRAAGFPELTFHDLRHTGASLMIAAGCHVKVIADQIGHPDGGPRPPALRPSLQRSPEASGTHARIAPFEVRHRS